MALVVTLSGLAGCSKTEKDTDDFHYSAATPVDGSRIAWDYRSMEQLAARGTYPRLLRLKDSSLAVVYESGTGSTVLIRSSDNGNTWSVPATIFSPFTSTGNGASTRVNCANPELIQLQNGNLISGCNYRPEADGIAPFSIALKRSSDNGLTWTDSLVVFHAETRFADGCWEPSFLQLPDGELQLYFANEKPYTSSNEQEISMLRSEDNGRTWTDQPVTVSFRWQHRDGMPVARVVNNEIVVVIEDNNNGQFKPYTVRCDLPDNWPSPVSGDSPNRSYALSETVDNRIYMGAPYLLVLPSGETIISYQTNRNRSSDWELSTMEVAIGDKTAHDFGMCATPFQVPVNREAKWNSIALWDEHTVVALTSSNFKSEAIAPWLIKGYLIPPLHIDHGTITEYPVFIGFKGEARLRAGIGVDNTNLYITCRVEDPSLFEDPSDKQKADGVYVSVDARNASLSGPDRGIYKLWCSYSGKLELWEGDKGHWESGPVSGIQGSVTLSADGYEEKLVIPKAALSGFNEESIRISFALSNYSSASDGYVEPLVNSMSDASNTWLKIEFE